MLFHRDTIRMNTTIVNKFNCQPYSNCSEASKESNSGNEWTDYLIFCVLTFLILLTIIGNIFVIITVRKRRRLQQNTSTCRFVTSLAVADLCVGVVVMPLAIYLRFQDFVLLADSRFNEICCYIGHFLDATLTASSILHLTCMTIDRYLAICKPLHYYNIMGKRRIIFMLISCWIIPSGLSFGLTYYGVSAMSIRNNENMNETEHVTNSESVEHIICMYDTEANYIYSLIGTIITFYIPSVFMLFCNIRLFFYVKRRGKKLNQLTSNSVGDHQRERQLQTEVKVAKTIVLMLTCFFVCWLPFFIIYALGLFEKMSRSLAELFTWLGYANSTINPCLYLFLSKSSAKCKRARNLKPDETLNHSTFVDSS